MKKMIKHLTHPVILIIGAVFITACISSPTQIQNEITPTLTPIASIPTNLPATVTPSEAEANPTLTLRPETNSVITETAQNTSNPLEVNVIYITIGDTVLSATLVENSSVAALKAALSNGSIIIDMRDYGSMEKVGSLGMDLPRNDEQITTEAGDLILYQGSMFVIYYAPNSWNFTRLGMINDISAEMLKEILGDGDITITLSLP